MKIIKNLFHGIRYFFHIIFNWIDRRIINPITKFILFLNEKTGKNSGKFEKWLTKRNTLVVLSLILAIGTFLVIDTKAIALSDSSAEVLYDQKVEAIYNSETYVVEGLPSKVDVTLIGRRVDLYLAKQLASNIVTVDLSNLGVGTHKVKLNYESAVNSVNYKLDPSSVTVIVSEKVSETRTAAIDVINKDKIKKELTVDNVSIDQTEVIIKGSEKTLKKVSAVKALVDVSQIVDPEVGVNELKDVKFKAYDSKGNVVKNVEIVPGRVTAKIEITSPSKEIPIKIIPTGEVAFGKAIASLTADITKITVYGESSKLDELEYIPVKVDVSNIKENKKFNVVISKPSGVRFMSKTSAVVTVSLGDEVTKEIQDVMITHTNLNKNYNAGAVGENSSKTTVIVSGTQEVLDAIDSSAITATVDLSGYGEGEYEVPVEVIGSDVKATYTSKITKIKIKITKK